MAIDIDSLIAELVNIANDAVFLVDSNGKIIFASKGATTLTGYSIDELVSSPIEMLVPPALQEKHQTLVQNHFKEGPSEFLMGKRGSVELVTKDGLVRKVGVSLAKRGAGDKAFVGAIVTDFTEIEGTLTMLGEREVMLSHSATELERSHRRFVLAQTLSGVGSWDWDIVSDELFWSDEVYTIFGLEPGEIDPTYQAFLDFIHPDDRMAVENAVQAALKDPSEGYDIIHRLVRSNGEERIVHENGMAEVDIDGKPVMMIGSVQDITESEQLKMRTQDALIREMEASRTKTEFLANLSHELRTPLNAVIGFSSILQNMDEDSIDPANMHEYANYINEAGTSLKKLVDEILEVSRIDLGIVELRETEVDLGKMVESVQSIINARAIDKGVAIIYDFDLKLPFLLEADELRIKQILLNLLSNGVKFTPAGGSIRIGIELREDGGIRLSVTDSGCGMEPDQVSKVLKGFNRAESAYTSTHQGGLGLGLTLTKAYCDLHDAGMTIDTAPDEGMTVCIDFPASRTVSA